MKIIPQSHEWITPLNRDVTMQRIERIARTCYQSEDAIKPGSDSKMVAMLCKNHHYAMVEHISLTIKFITDRGVANEIVRHRIGSYAQESTRYCNYNKDKFGNEITVIDHKAKEKANASSSSAFAQAASAVTYRTTPQFDYSKYISDGTILASGDAPAATLKGDTE